MTIKITKMFYIKKPPRQEMNPGGRPNCPFVKKLFTCYSDGQTVT